MRDLFISYLDFKLSVDGISTYTERDYRYLFRQYVRRTLVKDGIYRDVQQGIPLGCSLSPLMGAIYLRPLDEAMGKAGLFYAR